MEWILVIGAALAVPFAVAAITRRQGQTYGDRLNEVSEWFSRTGDAMQKGGSQMSAAGCGLTVGVTIPILGFVFFSWAGLIVGLLIAVFFAGAAFRGQQPPQQNP